MRMEGQASGSISAKACVPFAKICEYRNPTAGTAFGVSLDRIFVDSIK